MWTILVAATILPAVVYQCQGVDAGPSFIILSGVCIPGHHNLVLTGLTVQECLTRCLQETSICCRSVDFYNSETAYSTSCQLSVDWQGTTVLSNPCYLEGWDHYESLNKECTATGLASGQAALGITTIVPFAWKAEGQEYPEIKAASEANIACGPGGLQLYVNVAEFEGPVLEECLLQGNPSSIGTDDTSICQFRCECNRQDSCHTLYTTEPRPQGDVEEYQVKEGDSLIVRCAPRKSVPTPIFFWSTTPIFTLSTAADEASENNMNVVFNKRVNIDEDGNLYFSYVKMEDAKNGHIYKCNVFNEGSVYGGSYSTIRVQRASNHDVKPRNLHYTGKGGASDTVTGLKGQDLSLKCLFEGKPEVTIRWTRDTSNSLPAHHTVLVIKYGTELLIENVMLSDEATYKCTGSNSVGSTPQEINVKVEVSPVFEVGSQGPRDLTVTEGETAQVLCQAAAIPAASVAWFINGRPFDDVQPGSRYQINADGTILTIIDLCKDCANGASDLQNIQCNASNVHGYAYGSGYINVLLATRIPESMGPVDSELEYAEGTNLTLDCAAKSDDSSEITYKWQHNGKDIDNIPDKIYMNSDNNLVIKAEDREEAIQYTGRYTCIASNGHSEDRAEAIVSVEGVSVDEDQPVDIWVIGVTALAGLFFLAVILGLAICWRRRHKMDEETSPCTPPLEPPRARPDMSHVQFLKESELKKGDVVGSGSFGTVYKGIWLPEDEHVKIPVAIKVLKEGTSPALSRELLDEARVMASVSNPHCIRLLAVCMTVRMMLVTQLMPLGCLLSYVRKNKANTGSKVMLLWCTQIAEGMNYLEGRGIVHRDLAARNVLVESPDQVKITDFGLAKLLDYTKDSIQDVGGKMPIKWVALECMKSGIFTHRSDVWSYGVTIWEMFTYGQTPFADVNTWKIQEHLENGQRLPQPDICSIDIFLIMMKCWIIDPFARPSFKELAEELAGMCTDPRRYLVIEGDELRRLPIQTFDVRDLVGCISLAEDGDEEAMDAEEYHHVYLYPRFVAQQQELGGDQEYMHMGSPEMRDKTESENGRMEVPHMQAPKPPDTGDALIPMKTMGKSKPPPVNSEGYMQLKTLPAGYIVIDQ